MRDQDNEIKRRERHQREEKGREEQHANEEKARHDRDTADHNERGVRHSVNKIQQLYHRLKESLEQYERLMKGVEIVAGVFETLIKCHRLVSEVTEKVCHKIPMVGGIIQGVGLLGMVTLRAVGLRQSKSAPFHKKLSMGVKTVAGLGMIALAIVGIAIPPLGALMGAVIVGISFGLSLYKFARTAYKLHHAQLRHQRQAQQVAAQSNTSTPTDAPTLSRQLIHQQSKMKKRQYHVALGAITLGIAIALVSVSGLGAVILVGCAIGMNAAYLGKSLGLFSRVKRWFGRSLRRSRRQTRAQQDDVPLESPVASTEVITEEQGVSESPVARSEGNERALTNAEAKRAAPESSQSQTVERLQVADNESAPPTSSPLSEDSAPVNASGLSEASSHALLQQGEEDAEGGQQEEDGESEGGQGEVKAMHSEQPLSPEHVASAPEKNNDSNQGQDHLDDQQHQQQRFLQDELSVLSEVHHEHRSFKDVHPDPEPNVEPAEENVTSESAVSGNTVDIQAHAEELTEMKSAPISAQVQQEGQEEEDSEGGQQDEDDETEGGLGEVKAAHRKLSSDETVTNSPANTTADDCHPEPHPEPVPSSDSGQAAASSEPHTKARWTDLADVDQQQRRQQAIMREELLALHRASVHEGNKSFQDVHPEPKPVLQSDESEEAASELSETVEPDPQVQTSQDKTPKATINPTAVQIDEEDDDGEGEGESRHDDEKTDRQERLHP